MGRKYWDQRANRQPTFYIIKIWANVLRIHPYRHIVTILA